MVHPDTSGRAIVWQLREMKVVALREPTTPIVNDMLRISPPIAPPKNRRGILYQCVIARHEAIFSCNEAE
ncbi:MAG: hypothetical protein JNK00_06650 [Flavipsychrobacter sp.]|nr:hypothetical protein [Flavipsychrobacter sp.]